MSFLTSNSFCAKHKFTGFRPALKYNIILPYYFQRISSKERFPLFINKSIQRYRSDKANLLPILIGNNAKILRELKGLTIEQLADAIFLSSYRVRKLEAGLLRITPSVLVAITDFFGVSIETIVYQELSIKWGIS